MAIDPDAPEDSDYARIKRERLAAAQARVAKADRGELSRAAVQADATLVTRYQAFVAQKGGFKPATKG